MNREWITTRELAEIKGISERAVRKSIEKNKYVIRKCSKTYEILITSLEENVREKVTGYQEKFYPLANIPEYISEEHKSIALAKYDLIKKWDSFRKKEKNKTKAGMDFLTLYNSGLIHSELLNKVGKVAIGTIYEWHKKLKIFNDDWHVLVPNYTFGKKTVKPSLSELEQATFLSLLLHPNKLNVGKAIKITKYTLKERGIEEFCCDMTYRRFAKKYMSEHYDTWVLAREGSKALKDKVIPYIPRDLSKIEVGDVLIGDGHVLAFQVINPYTGFPTRATMVAYQDWKSTALVGFEIMLEENTQCIASALRNAIIRLGKIPKYCYQDNGKAFKAKYFIENGLSGLFVNLGIEPVYAKPYNARAKSIERFFREFQDSFETLFSSYVGSSIDNKPAYLKRNEKFHKGLHNNFVPTIEQVFVCLNKWLDFHYSQKCSNYPELTIGEVLESGIGQGVNVDTLNDLMMAREIKTVHQNGIRFLKADYFSEELYGYRGQVLIKYSLFDLKTIKVFTPKGKFICEAKRLEPVHPLANHFGEVKDIEDLKQKLKLQKKLERETERKYIQHLKREKAYYPMQTLDLEEYTEEKEIKRICLNEIEDEKVKEPICFQNRFEKYEYLTQKENLSKEEKSWIKEYESTDEFQDIYGNEEVINE